MEKRRRQFKSLLKIVFSIALIYFVFTKIDLREVWKVLNSAGILALIGAGLFLLLSKITAAIRLNLYFHQIGVRLTHYSNAKLYLLGMFYNLFLPGGIGGDAYKGYTIRKKYNVNIRRVIAVLFLDRLSGVLLLFIYACILALMVPNEEFSNHKWIFGAGIFLSLLSSFILNKHYFDYLFPIYWKSLGYSAIVQVFQLVCVLFILMSLSIEENILAYLFIFLISSAISVLPITVGGIGIRELVFLYGARWLGLDESISIGISILFFFITAVISFAGIYYHFRIPSLEVIPEELQTEDIGDF